MNDKELMQHIYTLSDDDEKIGRAVWDGEMWDNQGRAPMDGFDARREGDGYCTESTIEIINDVIHMLFNSDYSKLHIAIKYISENYLGFNSAEAITNYTTHKKNDRKYFFDKSIHEWVFK